MTRRLILAVPAAFMVTVAILAGIAGAASQYRILKEEVYPEPCIVIAREGGVDHPCSDADAIARILVSPDAWKIWMFLSLGLIAIGLLLLFTRRLLRQQTTI